jgi:hypothetical protein
VTSTINKTSTDEAELEQRALWRRQVTTLPGLRGGKRAWFALVVELVEQIGTGEAPIAMDAHPDIPSAIFDLSASTGGAAPNKDASTWHEYSKFLKAIELVATPKAQLVLTPTGQAFRSQPTRTGLGLSLAQHFRLLVESLAFFATEPATVEQLATHLKTRYSTTWRSLGGVRDRTDWLDALSLIEAIGGRKWRITADGESLLARSILVSPKATTTQEKDARPIVEAPKEIQTLLQELSTGVRTHESRSTYNIWVPSPASNPNKVENLRTIVNAAIDPIGRQELLDFIADRFGLRRSSVYSMMPFLRASGLLHEIGNGIYEATTPAKAWVSSNDDVNFIRILHANMRFVGEMIQFIGAGTTRAEMYAESAKYGLNTDKSRWIASFLEDTGLAETPRYGSLRATASGAALVAELPVDAHPQVVTQDTPPENASTPTTLQTRPLFTEELLTLSHTPLALNLGSGKAFENAICDAFRAVGFRASTISGAGDTDIVVRWRDAADSETVAIVEAKSRSNGHVAHTDISDVALETHKTRNQASFIAVVGPAFSGETIRNMASKRGWALIDAQRLGTVIEAANELGLSPETTALLFKVPNGLDELDDAIRMRRRELSVISFVLSKFVEEATDTGEAISARDISRDGRSGALQPTIDEVIEALYTITRSATAAIRVVEEHKDQKFSTYALANAWSAARQLRALADAIEASLPSTRP